MRFALDALEYAAAASYILWNDLSLYCVSLYNDIATTPLSLQPRIVSLQPSSTEAVERRDVSAGTAVLLTSSLFRHHLTELADLPFDEWIVFPAVRRARFCLTPEVSRVYPLVRRKLPFVTTEALELCEAELFVPFLEMDFRYLYRSNYEKELVKVLSEAVVIPSVTDITGARKGGVYRVVYDEVSLASIVEWIGIHSISKGGLFSWMYRGVAHFSFYSIQLYVTCSSMFPCDNSVL